VCAEYLSNTGRHPERAAALLGDLLQARPDFGPALALRAQQALDRGRLIQALPDAEKAIESSPDEARGYFVRGRIRLERGLPGVMMDLRRAVELTGSKDGRMLHWLAFALAEDGRKDDALKVQEQAAKLLPKDPEVMDLLKTLKAQK
jgi:tetratricopeptide (TPR) repeat protein